MKFRKICRIEGFRRGGSPVFGMAQGHPLHRSGGFKIALLLVLLAIGLPSQGWAGENLTPYYLGVDLSYINEMENCGATYQVNGEARDPYQIFADYGANLVRIRLWHTPTWTNYSTFDDVVRSLQRANALGMNVLLDFHYSDTWADPNHQTIPAAWADITDVNELGQVLYHYTYDTLMQLDALGLMPEMMQVGNEINTEILRAEDASGYPIDWNRNALLINRAIQAVRDADAQSNESPRVLLHIAKPESVEGWLLAATNAGVTDYDIIGISYYPGWSSHTVTTVGNAVSQLRYKFDKEVMVVETAYPWTLDSAPDASNILGRDFLVPDYPATPDGQKQFLVDLAQAVFAGGGVGIVYWEPAWVSTSCRTLWGQGSHWENATFFDFNNNNEVLAGIEFLQYPYEYPVNITLRFTFPDDATLPDKIFFWGDFTGLGKRPMMLPLADGAYSLHARLMPGTEIHYQFYGVTPASPENALLSTECMDEEGYTTLTIPNEDTVIEHTSDTCPVIPTP